MRTRLKSPKLDNHDQPDFKISAANPCNPILAFIKAYRMRGDAASLKNVLIENFLDVELSGAIKSLWDFLSG